jgi:lipopolysaccharide/colanic/teichoic acid biosynthesis glycosyltransferase
MRTALHEQPDVSVSTVEEKIHLEKRLPFDPENKTGPTVDLYFHELTSEKTTPQKLLGVLGSIFLGIFFLLTLPIIALTIKIFTNEPVFRKVAVPGRRGIVFQQYLYPTESNSTASSFFIGSFLKMSGLYKLPSVINIWKGQMNLVGPEPHSAKWSNHWNKQLSDFYKRYALNPGYVHIGTSVTDPDDIDQLEKSLDQELQYILRPSLKKDIKHLFGRR